MQKESTQLDTYSKR